MRISVVIPSYGRPADLRRCLDALKRQQRLPDEVLVAVRDDDTATSAALAVYDPAPLRLRRVAAGDRGASEARNRCLERATGEIIALTDDDAAPRPGWLAAVHARFAADPGLGGLGGPDWMDGRELPLEERATVVGVIQWWGRRVGNHHRGATMSLPVEWLKGANMSLRRAALPERPFGRLLRGSAAQFGEDFALSLALRQAGWRLEYDPAVAVDHFPGALVAGTDHRKLRDPASLTDAAHNETVALLGYLGPLRRAAFLGWSLLVGTRLLPGILGTLYHLGTGQGGTALSRGLLVWRGRLAGWRSWRADRRSRRYRELPRFAGEGSAPTTA